MTSSSSSVGGVSEMTTEPCEVCSSYEQFVLATVVCVDCSQRLCDRCSLPHKKMKKGPHDVRPLGDEPDGKTSVAVEKDVKKTKITGNFLKFVLFHNVSGPKFSAERGILSRASKFVVLPRISAERRNSGFSSEIVKFWICTCKQMFYLEILYLQLA